MTIREAIKKLEELNVPFTYGNEKYVRSSTKMHHEMIIKGYGGDTETVNVIVELPMFRFYDDRIVLESCVLNIYFEDLSESLLNMISVINIQLADYEKEQNENKQK